MKSKRSTPRQAEFTFDMSDIALPSPKRVAATTVARKHLPWEGNYAAYSIQFATEAVRLLSSDNQSEIIFDPFVGHGTTLDAASRVGVRAVGIELNPYSALLARGRVAIAAERGRVRKIISDIARRPSVIASENPLNAALSASLSNIERKIGASGMVAVRQLCVTPTQDLDNEIVALVALLHANRLRAKVHFRSNPAWLVRGADPTKPHSQDEEAWDRVAQASASLMIQDFELRRTDSNYSVHAADFRDVALKENAVRRFLTSPPYLNRLDYINPTLPGLEALKLTDSLDIDPLLFQMMGTSKMRKEKSPRQFASATANDFIATVANHASKASSTYYRRFFEQYFADLDCFFAWLGTYTTKDCSGIMVMQDSYYKEVKIPLKNITAEIAIARGFDVTVMASETHSRHMGRINPHQNAYAPSKTLTEFVFGIRRTGEAVANKKNC